MPRLLRHRRDASAATPDYAQVAPAVLSRRRFPSARTTGTAIGAGRALLGATFLVAPAGALRLLGVNTATATRVSWLSRMTAARDGVLGAGVLAASARGTSTASWLLAGAVSDAADAAALTAALRSRKIGGTGAMAMTAVAAAAAALGAWAAAGAVRRPSDR